MRITKTSIKNALKEGQFDPNAAGPMKIVAEMGNPDYCVMRAIELLHAANRENVIMSLKLLALSLVQDGSV